LFIGFATIAIPAVIIAPAINPVVNFLINLSPLKNFLDFIGFLGYHICWYFVNNIQKIYRIASENLWQK